MVDAASAGGKAITTWSASIVRVTPAAEVVTVSGRATTVGPLDGVNVTVERQIGCRLGSTTRRRSASVEGVGAGAES